MDKELYWHVRHMLKRLYFFVKRCVFRIQEKVDNVRLLFPLSKSIWWVLSTEVIKGLLYVWIVTGADAWLLTKTCNDAFKNDVFRDVVLGGMGIAGVILGLYCANLSSIFSSTYTNAPPSLSNAYQRDLVTNKCIRNSIRYIVVCILFLLVCLIDIDIYWFASVFFLVMTLNVVITFSTVGNRSYALADSFRIADTLRIQIGRMMKKASFRGGISTDQNSQKHFMKISDHALNIIMDIARYNAEIPKAQNQAWRSFMISNLALLLKYWNIKPTIYHDSLWFKDKAYYQQWHKASESEVRISTQAGVPLQPKYERDIWWLEDRILEINQIGLDKLIKDHDVRALCDYIHQLGKLSEIACKAKTLSYWADHLQCILEKLQNFIASIPKEEIDKQEELFAALAEGMCPVFIGMHVGINQEISSLNIDVLFGMITQYKSFNECDFSICSTLNSTECEKLYRQIKTEFSIEGKRITPDWYIQQIVGYQIYKEYGSVLNVLENAAKCIFTFGEFLLEQKYSYMSSVVFVHYFNLRQKTLSIVPGIESLLSSLEQMYFEKSIVWDPITVAPLLEAMQQYDVKLPAHLVKCCGSHAVKHWKKREGVPDFLGFCYNHLCENLIASLEQNNYTTFSAVYKDFFPLALLYFEYIRHDVRKRKEPHLQMGNVALMIAPLIECAAISGLAIIWGEFVADPRWQELIQDSLKSFVSASPEESVRQLTDIAQMVNFVKGNPLMATARGVVHIGWNQRIEHSIRNHETYRIEHTDFYSQTLVTESKWLKAYFRNSFHDYLEICDPEDVFFIKCVNPYLAADKQYKTRFSWEKWIDEEP